jgi:hypothetical protein
VKAGAEAGKRHEMTLRALLIWIVIACAETVHGILRVRLLNRRVGDRVARRIAVFSGSAILLTIGWFSIPWIAPASSTDSLIVGSLWLVLMLGYDIALGRFAFRYSYRRIAADFDIRKGNLLGIGMLILFTAPFLVGRLRGLY